MVVTSQGGLHNTAEEPLAPEVAQEYGWTYDDGAWIVEPEYDEGAWTTDLEPDGGIWVADAEQDEGAWTVDPEQEVELLFSLGPESIVQRKSCKKKAIRGGFIGRLGRFCMQLGAMIGGVFALEESLSPEQVVVEKLGPWVPLLIDSGSSIDACPRAFGTNYAQIRQQQPVHKVLKNASGTEILRDGRYHCFCCELEDGERFCVDMERT